jgi:hypothetical protein
MIPFILGLDSQAIQEKIDGHRTMFPNLPTTYDDWLEAGFIGGHPTDMIDQMNAFVDAGIERFMLQHNNLDDLASLELLAADVLPHMHLAA